ncbi:TPA: terminase small subunit [Serratia marcescens]|uniref:Terminase small subunit n=2 Tax=Serratia TaxID=613 RepID=A0A9X8VLZ3_SERMA|nr:MULTISPECIES: terminase small subunit [Serratia]MBS3895053.1 terminase small subunit [Serratia marcescens]TXE25891.1 terminase small subunit [Serratia ureilytica]HBC7422611.1 terminase small subunit [Serratia marcescens]
MASKKLTTEQQRLFDALTPLQKKFVTWLLKGKNQTDAYKAAGGKAKTDDSARVQASRMITFDNVQSFLQSVQYEVVSDAIMTYEEAMERLTTMGRARLRDLVEFSEHNMGADDDGQPIIQAVWRFKDSVKQTPELLDAIAELTAGKEGIRLKLHDARGAIKQLAEMRGWEAPKKSEHTINGLPSLEDLFGTKK